MATLIVNENRIPRSRGNRGNRCPLTIEEGKEAAYLPHSEGRMRRNEPQIKRKIDIEGRGRLM